LPHELLVIFRVAQVCRVKHWSQCDNLSGHALLVHAGAPDGSPDVSSQLQAALERAAKLASRPPWLLEQLAAGIRSLLGLGPQACDGAGFGCLK
jgi:hypothetical protein